MCYMDVNENPVASDLASTTVAAIISGKACQFCNGCVMGGRLREGVRFYPPVTSLLDAESAARALSQLRLCSCSS